MRALGDSGLLVSDIGLGGMPLSIANRPDDTVAVRVIHAALDAGMTFIDTADVYCLDDDDIGHNERLIARALATWSGDVVVATKGGLRRPDGAWTRDGRPEHLRAACEASLVALGVEVIDLYQLHAPDTDVPYAEQVGALAGLRAEGKVRHVGLSNVDTDQLAEAMDIVPIVSVQNRCNPHDTRAWSEGMLAACEQHGIAFLPWSPVGGGRGKVGTGDDPVLGAVGGELGVSPYEVALAWLLAASPVMIPIPGASREQSARSSAHAMGVTLSVEQKARLDAAFLP